MKYAMKLLGLSLLILWNAILCRAASEQTLYTFTGGNDGGNPYAGLIFDSKGNLYGTTVYGGTYAYGTVFELSPGPNGQWTENALHSFNPNEQDGIRPYASLIMDAAGNLYGTTEYGGLYGQGTVFEISPGPDGWTEQILHDFNPNGTDGFNPYANLIFDKHGNLYGTTYVGGNQDGGTVFELAPNPNGTWQETIIYNFDGTNGDGVYGGVVRDGSGNLYGTAQYGGEYRQGTVFELKHLPKSKWQIILLHSFDSENGDAFQPYSGLAIDKAGRLYGTTLYGGNDWPYGAVFEMKRVKGVWQESVIHSFNNTNDGFNPYGPLAIDSAGRLYGTTLESFIDGTAGAGTVFQLTLKKQNWDETILYQFSANGTAPGDPYCGVVLDSSGNIYGTTYYGGVPEGNGAVFEVTP
jgi:uncharacterized repeat protein (TIGR03803 family)